MVFNLITSTVVFVAFLSGSDSAADGQNCCLQEEFCCEIQADCCPDAALNAPADLAGANSQETTELAKLHCCVKRAHCCFLRRPCCDRLSVSGETATGIAVSSPTDESTVAVNTCCLKRAYCCSIQRPCCRGARRTGTMA